jgi:hypothetical protein
MNATIFNAVTDAIRAALLDKAEEMKEPQRCGVHCGSLT